MDDNQLVNEVMARLKEEGSVIVTQESMMMLSQCLHENVEIINLMREMDEVMQGRLHKNLSRMSIRLQEVAFTVERVAQDQE